MEEEILKRIETKLDIVVRLLATKAIEGKSKTEAILALGASGLETKPIAEIVGTTPATVSTRLSEAKKKSKLAEEEATKGAG